MRCAAVLQWCGAFALACSSQPSTTDTDDGHDTGSASTDHGVGAVDLAEAQALEACGQVIVLAEADGLDLVVEVALPVYEAAISGTPTSTTVAIGADASVVAEEDGLLDVAPCSSIEEQLPTGSRPWWQASAGTVEVTFTPAQAPPWS